MDNLKQINDSHGHAEGDRAIRMAADVLLQTFRQQDIVGRYGGDAITVMVTSGQKITLEEIEERLARAVSEHNRDRTQPYSLSLSIGPSRFDGSERTTLESLLEAADKRLYEQRRTGEEPE